MNGSRAGGILRLVVLKEIPEDENLCRQWNGLVQQTERPEVFYTFEWALAVYRAYRASVIPLLFLAYEEDSLVGVAALASDDGGTSFLAGTTADYCDFVSHPQRRAELVEAVFAGLRKLRVPMLQLANLPADSATFRCLRSAVRNHGYFLFSRPAYSCARVVLNSTEQRTSIKRSVESKQMLRRSLKAMERIGPVELKHLESWDSIAEVLPEFTRTHVARFLSTGRISSQALPERRVFLTELARLLSPRGWVTLTRLMVGEQTAAWNYGFRFAGSWFWYQPAIDVGLQRYSPGFCLLAKIVAEACDTPETDLVDLGLGAEEYKERVANGSRETLHVMTTTSILGCAREAVRYHAAVAVKSMPRLESWTRATLQRVSSLRKRIHSDGEWSFLSLLWNRCKDKLFGQPEVFFYEWPQAGNGRTEHGTRIPLSLQPIDLNLLAIAALYYVSEPETMTYLLRAANRLSSSENSKGFALVTAEGKPVHFSWVTEFESFYMSELHHRLRAPSPDSVLLFDCWTPRSERGQAYYGIAVGRLASQAKAAGKRPWIFSASTNFPSMRGVEKAGFEPRFSLIRKRRLFRAKVVQSEPYLDNRPLSDASAAD